MTKTKELAPTLAPFVQRALTESWALLKRHRAIIFAVVPYAVFLITYTTIKGIFVNPVITMASYYMAAAVSGFAYEFTERGILASVAISTAVFLLLCLIVIGTTRGGDAAIGSIIIVYVILWGIPASLVGAFLARLRRVLIGEKLVLATPNHRIERPAAR